jgi:CDP-diacylglycerol---serine O-phosphatidyltransferase
MAVRWRYILPNMVTCTSITIGLLAISDSVRGRFESSAWLVMLCVLLDKVDGTVARLLKATSQFGVEMDSLSDFVTFGVTPSVLIMSLLTGNYIEPTGLASHPAYPFLVYPGTFLFTIASALRLAKFNVKTATYGQEFFFGIPTTVSGATVVAFYLTATKYHLPTVVVQLIPAGMIVLALLMVSRVPLPKVIKRRTLFLNVFQYTNIFFIYLFGLLRLFPEYLITAGVGYILIGSIWAMARGIKPPSEEEIASAPVADPSPSAEAEIEPESPEEGQLRSS